MSSDSAIRLEKKYIYQVLRSQAEMYYGPARTQLFAALSHSFWIR